MKKQLLTLLALTFAAQSAFSQIKLSTESGDLSIRFAGRTNVDFGSYLSDSDLASDTDKKRSGAVMNDTRLGVQAAFDEKWSAKIEICYTNGSVSFRDLWMGYQLSESSSLQVGNFFMPFGAKPLGLAYKFVEDASADNAICSSRKIGAAYSYVSDAFNVTAGIFTDGDVNSKSLNNGYSVAAKAIFRPYVESGRVLHFGLAPIFTKPTSSLTYSGVMPTTLETNKLCTRTYSAEKYYRLEAEAIFIQGKFYAEAHYLNTQISIADADNEKVHGAYAQASFLILGEKQNYNKKTGLAAASSPKSLEVLARINTLNLDTQKETDFTVGVNYFFNKNINTKLNYVHAIGNVDGVKTNHDLVQLRLQFSF